MPWNFADSFQHTFVSNSFLLSVSLNLFPDTTFAVKFQEPSAYQVNQDIFVGQIVGDDDSSVRFIILNHILDGTIKTRGREFRIIDAGNGLQDITEAAVKKTHNRLWG